MEWAEKAKRLGIPASGDHRLLVDFKTGDSRYEVDVCAPCHSRRHLVSGEDRAGRPFTEEDAAKLRELSLKYGYMSKEMFEFLRSKK